MAQAARDADDSTPLRDPRPGRDAPAPDGGNANNHGNNDRR